MNQLDLYIHPTFFLDSDSAFIQELASKITQGKKNNTDKALALYYYVRDGIRYNPYNLSLSPAYSKASNILQRENLEGHCIDKAIALCALARAERIPTLLHFANVRNHIGTSNLEAKLGTNLMVFHGFMSFFLNGKWIKATPAFNRELCEKLGVSPLDFDGKNDSVFQEYDGKEGKYMTYEHDYGSFHDFPLDMFGQKIKKYYPQLFETDYVDIPEEMLDFYQ